MNNTIRKSAIFILTLCIAVSACLCGCDGNEPHFPVAVSDTVRSALELCTVGYKDSELDDIYALMCEGGTVKQLDEEYAIECLRKDDDGYHVIYKGNKRVLVLRFDADGNWIDRKRLNCIYRMVDTRGKFDKLEIGDNVTRVQKVDPTCYFPFLVEDVGDDLVTYHYTEDGYYTVIRYDADFNITDASWGLM